MKCPKCKTEARIVVNVAMTIPSELENRLTKTALRRADVKIRSVDWNNVKYYCMNKACKCIFV